MSRLVEDYITEIFNEKNVSPENREKLWSHYYEKLSGGVDTGWNDGFQIDDAPLVNSLKQSIAEFSAFKETAFRKDLEELLTKDGKLTPWSEFKKEAMKVSGDYNGRWLETEYHQTVANANMAAQWKDFERNTDLYPNVKLVSVGDARVRPEHKILDGTVRPYNDPFWNTHLPPLDWGCRCHVVQTDEEVTGVPGGFQTKIEFENNPAESGKIFGGSAYESRITVSEADDAKSNAGKWLVKANMSNDDNPKYINPEKEAQRNKDKELLTKFSEKVKRGQFLSVTGANLKSEVRISRSNLQHVLNHIRDVTDKLIATDIESVIQNSTFSHYAPLDGTKDPKNYGKKVGRGVLGYNYYISEWKGKVVEINMEVMKNGYEQPYAIIFK